MESTLQIIIIHVREKKGKLSHFISLWTKITNSITINWKERRKEYFTKILFYDIFEETPFHLKLDLREKSGCWRPQIQTQLE